MVDRGSQGGSDATTGAGGEARSGSAAGAPFISVIIPVCNDDGRCSEAIASALAQTLPPAEIIVVDDGSDPPFALGQIDPRVRLIRLAANAGPSAARNCGVAAAAGDWVAFLDADDLWEPNKLAVQLAGRAANVPCLLACNMVVEAGANRHPYNRSPPGPALDHWMLVERQSLQTSGLVLPRTLALRRPFDETLRTYEDWDFVLRIAASGIPIFAVQDCLGVYRRPARRSLPSREGLARQAAWLADPANVAGVTTRYHHYLANIFRPHVRLETRAALRTVFTLALRTPRPVAATLAVVARAWRARRARGRAGRAPKGWQ